MLNQVAPKDASGKPDITPRAVGRATARPSSTACSNACDAGDGLKDGMVFDPTGCRFDPKTLVCAGAKTDGCLSTAQVVAIAEGVRRAEGLEGPAGLSGLPLRHRHHRRRRASRGCCTGAMNPVGPAVHRRPRWTWTRGPEQAAADPQTILTATSTLDEPQHVLEPRREAALLPRRQRSVVLGARHDRLLRAHDEGERRRRAGHELEPAVPGARHGPLRRRPDGARHVRHAVGASSTGSSTGRRRRPSPRPAARSPGRSRPLCPYPQHAHYKGSGNPDLAESFECRE